MSRAVLSLHARGVPTCDWGRATSVRHHGRNAGRELITIGKAILLLVALQTWTTVYGLAAMLGSCLFFHYYRAGSVARDGAVWTPVGFLVFLPLLGVLWQTFARREAALRDLAKGTRLAGTPDDKR